MISNKEDIKNALSCVASEVNSSMTGVVKLGEYEWGDSSHLELSAHKTGRGKISVVARFSNGEDNDISIEVFNVEERDSVDGIVELILFYAKQVDKE